MFGLGPATKVYLALGATDMRKGFEGPYGLVRDRLLCEPISGCLRRLCRCLVSANEKWLLDSQVKRDNDPEDGNWPQGHTARIALSLIEFYKRVRAISKAMDRLVRSRMYFLAKDPHWTFLWWALRASDAENAQKRMEGVDVQVQFILRVYDVTGEPRGLPARNEYFDVQVIGVTDHWYLYVPRANRAYCTEAGFLYNRTRFHPLVRSNVLVLPPEAPSCSLEEAWNTLAPL